jgi:hypothetical protein
MMVVVVVVVVVCLSHLFVFLAYLNQKLSVIKHI